MKYPRIGRSTTVAPSKPPVDPQLTSRPFAIPPLNASAGVLQARSQPTASPTQTAGNTMDSQAVEEATRLGHNFGDVQVLRPDCGPAATFAYGERRQTDTNADDAAKDQSTIQRMAAVARQDKADEEDIIVMSSINYAVARAGGPVADFGKNADFSGMQEQERLIIVSHGAPGKIGDYDAKGVVDVLTNDKKSLPKDKSIGGITLLSCYAGVPEDKQKPESTLADQVAEGLSAKGYDNVPVRGSLGIAIASETTGARVVKNKKEVRYYLKVQFPLFEKLNLVKKREYSHFFGETVPSELISADEFLKRNGIEPDKLSWDEKMKAVGKLTPELYKALIEAADNKGLLIIGKGKDAIEVSIGSSD
ncbi:MAG: hypothetical protein GY719_36885 [bacterium]|nr:hypothetical protein [bacterium]